MLNFIKSLFASASEQSYYASELAEVERAKTAAEKIKAKADADAQKAHDVAMRRMQDAGKLQAMIAETLVAEQAAKDAKLAAAAAIKLRDQVQVKANEEVKNMMDGFRNRTKPVAGNASTPSTQQLQNFAANGLNGLNGTAAVNPAPAPAPAPQTQQP